MLNSCGIWEARCSGYQFSWYGNINDELVKCRLDRVVANQEWFELFPQAHAMYLQKVSSDHIPLITNLVGENWKRCASFKYDQRWVQREGFMELMSNFWRSNSADPELSLVEKIKKKVQEGDIFLEEKIST